MELIFVTLKKLRRLLSVLFQVPINYHATVAQSIANGDLQVEPSRAEIEAAARALGLMRLLLACPRLRHTARKMVC